MPKIENTEVYGMINSFKASKYPMCVDTNDVTHDYTKTIEKLAMSGHGQGHDNFMNGMIVQFDLTMSNKAWVELQRYHFIDFVSSQSTMHRISKMDIKNSCNKYVTESIICECERLKSIYLETNDKEDYLTLLYNIPSGFELTARMTTNYRQLKTIYLQRKTHPLPDWAMFCEWIKTLPYQHFITGEKK